LKHAANAATAKAGGFCGFSATRVLSSAAARPVWGGLFAKKGYQNFPGPQRFEFHHSDFKIILALAGRI
jgi:hypothetical protein